MNLNPITNELEILLKSTGDPKKKMCKMYFFILLFIFIKYVNKIHSYNKCNN